jgi:paraquat-inducible protein A
VRSGQRGAKPIAATDVTDERVIVCHDCGAVQRVPPLRPGGVARCVVCAASLRERSYTGNPGALAWALAALILFTVAQSLPLLSLEIEGRGQSARIVDGVLALWDQGMWPLALVVLVAAILAPLARILLLLAVLVPVQSGRAPAHLAQLLRWAGTTAPWAMTEVYLLGVIVAYVKLGDLARIETGVALWAFVGMVIAELAARVALDPAAIWDRLGPPASRAVLAARPRTTLIACHDCERVWRVRVPLPHDLACSRCGAGLHKRKPASLQRTWALVIAAAVLYLPANVLPVMTVISFGRGEADTILSGIVALIQAGMLPIGMLVLFASILVPVLKLIGLAILLVSVERGWTAQARGRTTLYRIIEGIGRWSMVDIFMIAILVALVELQQLATILPGPGAICFAAVVILTMLASMSFDPRLIWDGVERSGDGRTALRA